MTNGDKIRNMTDEELAHYLISREFHTCKSFVRSILLNTVPERAMEKLKYFLSLEINSDEIDKEMGFEWTL